MLITSADALTHSAPPTTPQVAPVSATAGLCYFAQLMRQRSGESLRSDVKRRAGAMFEALAQQGVSFNTVVDVSAVDSAPGIPTGWGTTNTAKWLLWEDPLLHHLSAQVRVHEAEGSRRAIALRRRRTQRGEVLHGAPPTAQSCDHDTRLPTSVTLSTPAALSHYAAHMCGVTQVAAKDMALWYEQVADRLEMQMMQAGAPALGAPDAFDPHPLGLPAALARALSLKRELLATLHAAYAADDRRRLGELVDLQVPSKHVEAGRSSPTSGQVGNVTMNHTASDGTRGSSGVGGRASKPRASRDERSRHGLVGRTVAALDRLQQEHYAVWRSYYKPYGWEVLELRYGGQRARLQRVGSLIESYLLGEVRHASALPRLVKSSRLHPTPAS